VPSADERWARRQVLADKEFIGDFADSRDAKADAPGISLVRPGTILAHADACDSVAAVLL
jgi:hypothetical protein